MAEYEIFSPCGRVDVKRISDKLSCMYMFHVSIKTLSLLNFYGKSRETPHHKREEEEGLKVNETA